MIDDECYRLLERLIVMNLRWCCLVGNMGAVWSFIRVCWRIFAVYICVVIVTVGISEFWCLLLPKGE